MSRWIQWCSRCRTAFHTPCCLLALSHLGFCPRWCAQSCRQVASRLELLIGVTVTQVLCWVCYSFLFNWLNGGCTPSLGLSFFRDCAIHELEGSWPIFLILCLLNRPWVLALSPFLQADLSSRCFTKYREIAVCIGYALIPWSCGDAHCLFPA